VLQLENLIQQKVTHAHVDRRQMRDFNAHAAIR
jgi:hypothetical protein